MYYIKSHGILWRVFASEDGVEVHKLSHRISCSCLLDVNMKVIFQDQQSELPYLIWCWYLGIIVMWNPVSYSPNPIFMPRLNFYGLLINVRIISKPY